MINNQIAYYLGSKILAAILNLVTMALFVRIGGKETYGLYIIQLAWAYMLYSITIQWLRFSFFACFKKEISANLVATYLRALMIGFLGVVFITVIGAAFGVMTFKFAVGVAILIFGLAAYEAFTEIARTQLQARTVAVGVIMRAILMLVFGVIALSFQGSVQGSFQASAFLLALSVGFAHLGAALILLLRTKNIGQGQWSDKEMKSLWRYGKSLIPAFGLDAVGLQMDRLMLARFTTMEIVGVYGAAADFIRQTMIVVAEAIAGAYFTVARNTAEEGQIEETTTILGQAFLAYTALTFFVGAFIMRFDRIVFDLLFGADMGAEIEPIVGFIILSNIATIYRAYYFSQAIYLTKNAHYLLYSDGAQVLMTLLTGALFLVPFYGASGAAIAMFLGQLAGIVIYLVAWRQHYILKLPYGHAGFILAIALATYFLTGLLESWMAGSIFALILNLLIFATISALVAWQFNILSFKNFLLKLTARRAGGTV